MKKTISVIVLALATIVGLAFFKPQANSTSKEFTKAQIDQLAQSNNLKLGTVYISEKDAEKVTSMTTILVNYPFFTKDGKIQMPESYVEGLQLEKPLKSAEIQSIVDINNANKGKYVLFVFKETRLKTYHIIGYRIYEGGLQWK